MAGKLNILCTGGAGYIGSHTVVQLLATKRFRCVLCDDFSNANEHVIGALEEITGEKQNIEKIDLCDRAAVLEMFKREKFDAVIHYAAKKSVAESIAKPLEYYDNNLNSLMNILYAMRETGCKNMVFSSSACVYAEHPEGPIPETHSLSPPNPYGSTKLMGESILRDCAEAMHLNVVSLRYFNPVGNHESGLMGEDPKVLANLLPYIQQVAVGKVDHVNVFGNDWKTRDGTGVRDYLHVMDLADGHIAALDFMMKHAKENYSAKEGGEFFYYDCFNLGTGKGTTVLEMITAFEKASGVKVKYEIAGRRAKDLESVTADPSKAEKAFNWKATRSIEKACADAWKWQSSHPDGFKK